MSALATTERPVLDRGRAGRPAPDAPAHGSGPAHGSRPAIDEGPTLDDVVSRTWEVLRAGLPASCLVCGAELEPRPHPAGTGIAGGRCGSCGSTLG